MAFLKRCYVNTTDAIDCLPVTHDVLYAIRDASATAGVVSVVVPGPGAGVTIGEKLPDVLAALRQHFEAQRPSDEEKPRKGKDQWRREIGVWPRVQAALMGRSVHVPFEQGKLCLDPYSDVLLCDFEAKGQRREFLVHVLPEAPPPSAPAPAMDEEYY